MFNDRNYQITIIILLTCILYSINDDNFIINRSKKVLLRFERFSVYEESKIEHSDENILVTPIEKLNDEAGLETSLKTENNQIDVPKIDSNKIIIQDEPASSNLIDNLDWSPIIKNDLMTPIKKDSITPKKASNTPLNVDNKELNQVNDQNSKKSIFYLKTHQTHAHLQTLLFRIAEKYDYEFVIPKDGKKVFGDDSNAQWEIEMVNKAHRLASFNFTKPLILLNEMKFHPRVFDYFPPTPETVRLTILRDPATLFPTIFNKYYDETAAFKQAQNITSFLARPGYYNQNYWSWLQPYSHNSILYELGFGHCLKQGIMQNEVQFTDYHSGITEFCSVEMIKKKVSQWFDLVLIVEFLDESLLILKHHLNFLTYEDLIYIKHHQQSSQDFDSGTDKSIQQKSREWNQLEFSLYQHFNQSLFQKINSIFGGIDSAKMKEERQNLNSAMKGFSDRCIDGEDSVTFDSKGESLNKIKLKAWLNFDVFKDCRKSIRTSSEWLDLIYARQKWEARQEARRRRRKRGV